MSRDAPPQNDHDLESSIEEYRNSVKKNQASNIEVKDRQNSADPKCCIDMQYNRKILVNPQVLSEF